MEKIIIFLVTAIFIGGCSEKKSTEPDSNLDVVGMELVSEYELEPGAYNFAIKDNFLIRPNDSNEIVIFDISSDFLEEVSNLYIPFDDPLSIYIYQNYGFVFFYNNSGHICSMSILDFSDTNNPSILSTIEDFDDYFDATYINHGCVVGEYLYIGDFGDIQIFNISDITNPTYETSFSIPGECEDIQFEDNIIYCCSSVAGYYTGYFFTMDVQDPLNPLILSQIETIGYALESTIDNEFAFVACADSGLLSINISNPSELFISDQFDTSGWATHLYKFSTNIFVGTDSEGGAGVYIINSEDPENLAHIYLEENFTPWDLNIYRDYLYALHIDKIYTYHILSE